MRRIGVKTLIDEFAIQDDRHFSVLAGDFITIPIAERDTVLNDGAPARARDFTASDSEKAARFTKVSLHLERGWPSIHRRPGIYEKPGIGPPLILHFLTPTHFLCITI